MATETVGSPGETLGHQRTRHKAAERHHKERDHMDRRSRKKKSMVSCLLIAQQQDKNSECVGSWSLLGSLAFYRMGAQTARSYRIFLLGWL